MASIGIKAERAASRMRTCSRFGRLSSEKAGRVAISRLVSRRPQTTLLNARFRIGQTSLSPLRARLTLSARCSAVGPAAPLSSSRGTIRSFHP
eukprot:13402399-Alexandrium_andersonii.AAC.1